MISSTASAQVYCDGPVGVGLGGAAGGGAMDEDDASGAAGEAEGVGTGAGFLGTTQGSPLQSGPNAEGGG